jgi:hypothetical protein
MIKICQYGMKLPEKLHGVILPHIVAGRRGRHSREIRELECEEGHIALRVK